MKPSSAQSKSFLILFGVAAVGTYLAVMLARGLNPNGMGPEAQYQKTYFRDNEKSMVASANSTRAWPTVSEVDTSSWQTYRDNSHGLSFRVRPEWKVRSAKAESDGFSLLEIDPGKNFYDMKIHISENGYYALDGLPKIKANIGGLPALNVSNLLYGVQSGNYYFTFENGLSTEMINDFNALIRSVSFGK